MSRAFRPDSCRQHSAGSVGGLTRFFRLHFPNETKKVILRRIISVRDLGPEEQVRPDWRWAKFRDADDRLPGGLAVKVRRVFGDVPRELPGAADDAIFGASDDEVKRFEHKPRKGKRLEVTRQRNGCGQIPGVSSASF